MNWTIKLYPYDIPYLRLFTSYDVQEQDIMVEAYGQPKQQFKWTTYKQIYILILTTTEIVYSCSILPKAKSHIF